MRLPAAPKGPGQNKKGEKGIELFILKELLLKQLNSPRLLHPDRLRRDIQLPGDVFRGPALPKDHLTDPAALRRQVLDLLVDLLQQPDPQQLQVFRRLQAVVRLVLRRRHPVMRQPVAFLAGRKGIGAVPDRDIKEGLDLLQVRKVGATVKGLDKRFRNDILRRGQVPRDPFRHEAHRPKVALEEQTLRIRFTLLEAEKQGRVVAMGELGQKKDLDKARENWGHEKADGFPCAPWCCSIRYLITIISTDFAKRGEWTAKLILEDKKDQLEIPFMVRVRPSV